MSTSEYKPRRLGITYPKPLPCEWRRILKRCRHVATGFDTKCWIWTGRVDSDGYGEAKWRGAKRFVHRIAYAWSNGSTPARRDVEHVCKQRACCNPAHIITLPPKQNAGGRSDGGDATLVASSIIAALSPGLRWERNIEAAERVICGEGLEGLGVRWYDGVRKARRILAGESPSEVLQGNKVRAFADNIHQPHNSQRVCIDGHAYAIWSAERLNLDDVPAISDKLYFRIQSDYIDASNIVGIKPHQIQAISWTAWRRLHNVSSAHYLPLFEELVG